MSNRNYDDDDLRHEVESCCIEAFSSTREGEVLKRLRERYGVIGFLATMHDHLCEMEDAEIESTYDDIRSDVIDSAAESRDPYGYRGLRRSDFL